MVKNSVAKSNYKSINNKKYKKYKKEYDYYYKKSELFYKLNEKCNPNSLFGFYINLKHNYYDEILLEMKSEREVLSKKRIKKIYDIEKQNLAIENKWLNKQHNTKFYVPKKFRK